MKANLALRFTPTHPKQLIQSIRLEINQFEAENHLGILDQAVIQDIVDYFIREPASGVIIRKDIIYILKTHYYHWFGRFWSALPQRLEALLEQPTFSNEALLRGDVEAQTPSAREHRLKNKVASLLDQNEDLVDQLNAKNKVIMSMLAENTELKAEVNHLREQQCDIQQQLIQTQAEIVYWRKRYTQICSGSSALSAQTAVSSPISQGSSLESLSAASSLSDCHAPSLSPQYVNAKSMSSFSPRVFQPVYLPPTSVGSLNHDKQAALQMELSSSSFYEHGV